MDRHTSGDISSSKAVLLGALSSGVNGPTWFVLKIIFLLLGICLAAMLALAFSSSDAVIAGHVILLVLISGILFVLLNRLLKYGYDLSMFQSTITTQAAAKLKERRKRKRGLRIKKFTDAMFGGYGLGRSYWEYAQQLSLANGSCVS